MQGRILLVHTVYHTPGTRPNSVGLRTLIMIETVSTQNIFANEDEDLNFKPSDLKSIIFEMRFCAPLILFMSMFFGYHLTVAPYHVHGTEFVNNMNELVSYDGHAAHLFGFLSVCHADHQTTYDL